MKVTLISLDRELLCFGIRTLSACLRRAGYNTQLIFMIPEEPNNAEYKFQMTYSTALLERLGELVSDSDLIGLSLMSNQFVQAAMVTEYLRSRHIKSPIVWGGVQPTVEPDECIKHADIVCIGEGEEALVELVHRMVNGDTYSDTRNMWFRTPEGIARNQVRPLIKDLDTLPFPDYSCENHFIGRGERLDELNKMTFLRFQGERFRANSTSIPYMFMTSRGCPFSCTYCNNSVYKELYQGQKLLRWRSDRNIIEELQYIQETLAPISYVYMVDDNFTARPTEKLRSFCELYRKTIGIPFYAQVSPLTVSEEKMEILFDSGCAHITMGVETASARIAGIYNRSKEHKILPEAISLIEKYRTKMNPPPTYQFIIDNPYETIDETLETLRLAVSFPRPWYNPIYSLMLFPGVPLYRKAMEDGIIKDKYAQIYTRNWRSQSKPFFQFWIRLYHANIHPVILKVFLMPWLAKLLANNLADTVWKNRMFRWLWDKPT